MLAIKFGFLNLVSSRWRLPGYLALMGGRTMKGRFAQIRETRRRCFAVITATAGMFVLKVLAQSAPEQLHRTEPTMHLRLPRAEEGTFFFDPQIVLIDIMEAPTGISDQSGTQHENCLRAECLAANSGTQLRRATSVPQTSRRRALRR